MPNVWLKKEFAGAFKREYNNLGAGDWTGDVSDMCDLTLNYMGIFGLSRQREPWNQEHEHITKHIENVVKDFVLVLKIGVLHWVSCLW